MYRLDKLSFEKENFGIPYNTRIHNIICHSWSMRAGRNGSHIDCTYTFKKLKDNDRLGKRVGDIIRFDYRFGKLKGYFGVILERYKILKEKPIGTFNDYGAVVLISNGKRKGEVYNVSPQRLAGLIKTI